MGGAFDCGVPSARQSRVLTNFDGAFGDIVTLAHELGHCETGAFYNRYAARDIRQKYENRANKWAYKKLVPQDELAEACLQGYREPWELAEYFGVTEDFLRGALKYYQERDYIVT